MKATAQLHDLIRSSYVVSLLALLGIMAIVSAILIAWPALAYLAAKLF